MTTLCTLFVYSSPSVSIVRSNTNTTTLHGLVQKSSLETTRQKTLDKLTFLNQFISADAQLTVAICCESFKCVLTLLVCDMLFLMLTFWTRPYSVCVRLDRRGSKKRKKAIESWKRTRYVKLSFSRITVLEEFWRNTYFTICFLH